MGIVRHEPLECPRFAIPGLSQFHTFRALIGMALSLLPSLTLLQMCPLETYALNPGHVLTMKHEGPPHAHNNNIMRYSLSFQEAQAGPAETQQTYATVKGKK